MREDYDYRGSLKPDATASYEELHDLSDLNKYTVFDPLSFAALKAYLEMLKQGHE